MVSGGAAVDQHRERAADGSRSSSSDDDQRPRSSRSQRRSSDPVRRDGLRYLTRLITRHMPGQRKLFVLALVMLALEAGAAVAEAYPLAYLIDFLQGRRPAITWFGATRNHTVLALSLVIVGIGALNSACDSVAEILLARAGRLLGFNVRTALFGRLQRLSLAFHDRRRTGDVVARVTGDVDTLEDFIIKSSSDIAGSVLVLVFTLAFLGSRSWAMLLAAATIVPLVSVVSHHFSTRIRVTSKRMRSFDGEVASSTQEMLSSIRVIQTYGRAGYEQGRFEEHSTARVSAAMRTAVLQAEFSFVVKVLEALVVCAVVWLGLALIDHATITIGLLVMFVLLIQNMFKPTRRIIQEWGAIGKVLASSERIGELLDRRPTVTERVGALAVSALRGDVRFEAVSFSYEADGAGAAEPVRVALQDVSIHVPAGQVLALIGHTGAGKSTILQLLPRLYDATEGAVLIDDHDVRDLTLDSLRANISAVLQETILFSGTVAENIAYGRMDATQHEIEAAAQLANAHEFIEQLPEGYDTLLGERGANLSGGQRQRIAIARAYVRRAPILLLDEPTTGLDVESSAIVLDALHTLMRDKTTIIVSHDLKLIRHADRIVLLRHGRVEQQGTHESLLAAGGLYARIHAHSEGEPPPVDDEDDLDVTTWTASSREWLDRSLPTLAVAFDGDAMAARLARTMVDARYELLSCRPGKAAYLPDGSCSLRYELLLRDPGPAGDAPEEREAMVLARVFSGAGQAWAERTGRVDVLAEQAAGHPLLAPFREPVSVFDDLCMLVTAFPIDPELPSLVLTTDGRQMRPVLAAAVDDADFVVVDVDAQPGHCNLGRQHRCVVRYGVHGRDAHGRPQDRVLYGKVADDDRAERAVAALDALHTQQRADPRWSQVRLPEIVLHRADLGLLVLDEVAGAPTLAAIISGSVRGQPDTTSLGAPSAPDGVEQAARVAALLHGTPSPLHNVRTIDEAVDELLDLLTVLSPMAEPLALWLVDALDVAGRSLAIGTPEPRALAHGDFTHTQLLFSGSSPALIDFDTVCCAEPALDLGHFTAYLRLVAAKAARSAAREQTGVEQPGADQADVLCAHFLDRYLAGRSGSAPAADIELRRRAAAYELLSLVRIAGHSWHKLKSERLAISVGLVRQAVQRVSGDDPGRPPTPDERA